jgi:hypothetical protein
MIYPLIPVRLHGWLDDLVALTYLGGAYCSVCGRGRWPSPSAGPSSIFS